MGDVKLRKVGCFFCHNNCGLLAYVKDGRVVKVEDDPEHPLSRGYICERAKRAVEWLYHPDQLKYPLKRAGERGEGKWKRISWDKALDDIAEKLKELKEKYGPESLAFCEGTYRSDHYWARARFANLFGNPQNLIDPGTICFCDNYAIDLAICGWAVHFTSDPKNANCIVLWGVNPAEAGIPLRFWEIVEERIETKPKAKLIVIDPRLTESARRADLWLQIRPGTDAALALGWINIIIKEELYDKEFVEKWCFGFDKLKERTKEYSPQKVSNITWIPEDKLIESARMYAKNKPSCIHANQVATEQIGLNASRVEQARMILRAITGNLDVKGGNLFLDVGPKINGKLFIQNSVLELAEKCSPEQRKKQLGADRFKLMTWPGWELLNESHEKMWGFPLPITHLLIVHAPLLFRAILTGKLYPIKALITWASNPLLWAPNTKLVYKALKSPNLELHVVLDYWMTPTAELADYVLPAASWLERPLCTTHEGFSNEVLGGVRAIEPLEERRVDYDFWRGLGLRLGQGEHWPWKTYEELIAYRLKSVGLTYEEFSKKPWVLPTPKEYKKYEKMGFPTPTGKVELYCTIFEKLGQDPLPYYEEPAESPNRTPKVARRYPLILITGGRFRPMFHSEHRQIGMGLREMHPDPIMEIHPETARRYGVRDGDWVWIETRRGRIKQRARRFTGIDPRVVHIEHGWWYPEDPGEEPFSHGVFRSNANVLTLDDPDYCDPLVGNWCNRGLLCRVYRVEDVG